MSTIFKLLYLALLALPAATNPVPPNPFVEEQAPGIPDRGIIRHQPFGHWPWWFPHRPSRLPSTSTITPSTSPPPQRTVITTTTESTTVFTTELTTLFASSSSVAASSSNSPSLTGFTIIAFTTSSTVGNATSSSSSSSSFITSSIAPNTISSSSFSFTTSSIAPNATPSSSFGFTNSSSTIASTTPIASNSSITPTSSVAPSCSITASPPAPTQTGIVSGCSKYYVAQVGDFCSTIADKFGINVNTFMAWNPAVLPPTCVELLPGDAYCVQVCGNASLTSISISSTPVPSSTTSAPVPTLTQGPNDVYNAYCGNGSVGQGWPSQDQWLQFDNMFDNNKNNMKVSCGQWSVPNDSDQEIADMKNSIVQVANISKVDSRFILAIIMQESAGCVRVITTAYSHLNPGLMQSFNGTGSCNTNQAPLGIGTTSANSVMTPCPASEIKQMIMDGANGTIYGDGLRQNYAQQNLTGATGYYRTAKIYNGGMQSFLTNENSLESGCCTQSYVSDIANRLTGWVNAARNFTC